MMTIPIRLCICVSVLLTRLFALPEANKTATPKDCGNHFCEAKEIANTNLHYKKHGCYCDDLCNYYNDCCSGYKPRTPSRIKRPKTECRSPTGYNDTIMMIVSCAADFKGSRKIVDKCQKNDADIINSLPVTGQKIQLVYRNVFCALCNGETNYTFWNTKFSCPHNLSDLNITKVNLTECHRSLQNPYLNTSHLCSEYLVKSCRNSTTRKCETGSNGVVFSTLGVFYKNFQCFQCNKKPDEELICENLPSEKELTTPYSFMASSYFILIDFNRRDVRLNGNSKMATCPNGHWYNYRQNRCIRILHFENNSTNDAKVLNCSLEKLKDNEYILLANQSIYRNSTNSVYDEHSYFMNNKSVVFICETKTQRGSSLEASLTLIGMCISLSALAFLILFYLLMPAIWNLSGLIYLSFSFSLFLAQILFLISRYSTPPDTCTAIAKTMHYAFLVSFFWLNVVTVNIWLTVCRDPCETISRKSWRRFFFYSLYAWLAPFLILIPAIALDKHRPNSHLAPAYGYNGVCWLNNGAGVLLFFAAPLAIIIVFNFAAYLHTAITIYRMRQFAVQHSGKGNIKIIVINAKLCLLTGITWCFGYVATAVDSQKLRIIFVILNATYGLWLAICFLSTENVFAQLKQKFRYVTQTSSTKTLT